MRAKKKQVQPRFGAEKALGVVLREIRKSMGLSQEEFAFETSLDRTTVSMLERGLMSPTLRTLVRLSKRVRLLPSEMVRRAEKTKLFWA